MTERPIRFEIDRPLEFRFTDARLGPVGRLQGRTVNISSGGLLFRTDHTVGVGRKLDLIVRMSATPETAEVDLRVLGMVIRSGPGWAALRIRKHQLAPTGLPDTSSGTHKIAGRPGGPVVPPLRPLGVYH
jgi:PilZ domain